ncbi:MAG: DMT family transporter [Atopobiaceae bacterium]|nr:DMT family transporter [Atopobiaceae bacterium]
MHSAKRATALAILAAALYALMTPVSKLMQASVAPVMEAGLLYVGAGVGMAAIILVEKVSGHTSRQSSLQHSDLRFVVAMVALDMVAPILLMLGLALTAPQVVSLLNNFEIVATTVIAVLLFSEKVSPLLVRAIVVITCACMLLSLEGAEALRLTPGALLVLGACVCWGFENNCTASLSDRDVRQVVLIKGLGSGAGSLVVSVMAGEQLAALGDCLTVMVLGFFSVGLSVWCYVKAQARLGAARTSAFYATSPFIGAVLGMLTTRELPGLQFWVAFALMALGVWLSVQDATANES